jgi:hypothetical protein
MQILTCSNIDTPHYIRPYLEIKSPLQALACIHSFGSIDELDKKSMGCNAQPIHVPLIDGVEMALTDFNKSRARTGIL